ncbi:MAG: PaaI family thioesterase [bacterium]|nr:PaaI family thioesterase [bacterium]
MYLSAPTNAHYQPGIEISQAAARVTIDVRSEFHHAAGGVHGSVYFKALDDACFFAANSVVEDVFVLTSQFNIQLVRPISEGRLIAAGRVLHSGRSSQIVRGELHDESGNLLAVGQGTFIRSGDRLTSEMGYRLP